MPPTAAAFESFSHEDTISPSSSHEDLLLHVGGEHVGATSPATSDRPISLSSISSSEDILALPAAQKLSEKDVPCSRGERARGVALAISASAGFCATQLAVRLGSTRMGLTAGVHVLMRGPVLALLAACLLWRGGAPAPSRTDAQTVVARGVVGALAMFFKYDAVARLPLALATAVIFLSPAMTIVMSSAILSEPIESHDLASCVASFTGVLTIALSHQSGEHPVVRTGVALRGMFSAVLGAFFTALSYIVIRGGPRVDTQWNILSVGVCGTLVGLVALGPNLTQQVHATVASVQTLLVLLGAGITAFLGATCVNIALELISAGTVSVLRILDIPVSFALALVFLGERVTSLAALGGSGVICASSLSLALSSARRSSK